MLQKSVAAETRETLDARLSELRGSLEATTRVGEAHSAGLFQRAATRLSHTTNALAVSGYPTSGGAAPAGDVLSTLSDKVDPGTRPSVISLRDRLLREARSERQRCLEVAEAAERRRAELSGASCDQADGGGDAAAVAERSVSKGTSNVPGLSPTLPGEAGNGWSEADDKAQAEALRTIQLLSEAGSVNRQATSRLEVREGELRVELELERSKRQDAEKALAAERKSREAAQKQVLCLEDELDSKEASLQAAERKLEASERQFQQAQAQLRALQNASGSVGAGFTGDYRLGGPAHSLSSAMPMPGSRGEDNHLSAARLELLDRQQRDEQRARLLDAARRNGEGYR
eukprot:TRINITY_DN32314_c0_g1_i1.p1 TRINITY_DN32314_c0_g1~~TRINITY_DN32314_c0_g1_i1.p1  ORF type:complete len:345 (-),score=104.64 TRINITY_DN32314_c0_g1_i1:166-1200(-)